MNTLNAIKVLLVSLAFEHKEVANSLYADDSALVYSDVVANFLSNELSVFGSFGEVVFKAQNDSKFRQISFARFLSASYFTSRICRVC